MLQHAHSAAEESAAQMVHDEGQREDFKVQGGNVVMEKERVVVDEVGNEM